MKRNDTSALNSIIGKVIKVEDLSPGRAIEIFGYPLYRAWQKHKPCQLKKLKEYKVMSVTEDTVTLAPVEDPST